MIPWISSAIFVLSIGLQLVAAAVALLLIPTTGRRRAWVLISLAMLILAAWDFLLFTSEIAEGALTTIHPQNVIVLVVGLLMLAGVLLIRRYVIAMQEHANALKNYERRLETIIDFMPDPMFAIDRMGVVIAWNRAMEDLTGVPAEDMLWKGNYEYALPFYKVRRPMLIDMVFRSNETAVGMFNGVGKEKETLVAETFIKDFPPAGRYFAAKAAPLYNAEGVVVGAIESVRDITESRKASEKVAEQERLLSDVFTSIQDGISVSDRNMVIQSVNPVMERWYAHALPLVGKKCFEAYHGRTTACEVCPTRKTLATGEAAYEVVPMTGPDRKIIGWMDLYSFPLKDTKTGEMTGVIEYVRDISTRRKAEEALRESEERYRGLFENAPDVIYSVSANDGTILSLSPAFEKLTGWRCEEWIGKHVADIVHSDDLPKARDMLKKVWRGATPPPYELRIRSKSGKFLVGEFTSSPQYKDGKVVAEFGVVRDITARKQLEDQLRQSQKMDAIGQMAGGIAHDFNNLLTAITGFSDLALLQLNAQDPLRKDVEEIRKAADHAAALTRQLLAFSRRQVLQAKVMDLNAVVCEMQNILQRVIGEDIHLEARLDPNLQRIRADPGQIEQIIMNLAINGRDAMPRGGRLIIRTESVVFDYSAAARSPDARLGHFVCLSVTDTGLGIDAETLPHIFEPFFSTKERGTGLGLATVYGIARQHGGWVTVESQPGRGATFRVYLPAFFIRPEEKTPAAAPVSAIQGTGQNILLVEDEMDVRNFTQRALEKHGYRVIEAGTVREALDLFEREAGRIDMVFSDVVLPDQSGVQLVDEISARKPGLRVLLSSGYTDHKSAWQAIRDRRLPFLQKPYTLTTLLQAVHDTLNPGPRNRTVERESAKQ